MNRKVFLVSIILLVTCQSVLAQEKQNSDIASVVNQNRLDLLRSHLGALNDTGMNTFPPTQPAQTQPATKPTQQPKKVAVHQPTTMPAQSEQEVIISMAGDDSEPVTQPATTPASQSVEVASRTTSQPRSKPAAVEEAIPPQLAELIKKTAQSDPLGVADLLYQSGRPKAAAAFYEDAMKDKNCASRQWCLFQLGNCLAGENLKQAAQYYEMLLEEFPDESYACVAKVRQQYLTWLSQRQSDSGGNR